MCRGTCPAQHPELQRPTLCLALCPALCFVQQNVAHAWMGQRTSVVRKDPGVDLQSSKESHTVPKTYQE